MQSEKKFASVAYRYLFFLTAIISDVIDNTSVSFITLLSTLQSMNGTFIARLREGQRWLFSTNTVV